jgi:predicted XRE-type DNA-binding protein
MARKARRKKSTKAQIAARRKKEAASLKKDGIPRAVLGRETQRQIERFNLSRDDAAVIVKDAASQMSRLMTGHLAEFSADRLAKMLTRLGSSITITVKHAKKLGKRGRVVVRVER